jgi:topoisomerase IV subunit B
VSVADDGRGTDTRDDAAGRTIKKPVMGTKDLRFFDDPDAETLPDGHARRGMSVVAALSQWLIHTNRRTGGSSTQRYEHGVPTRDLTPVADDGTTGTTVHFQPDIATGEPRDDGTRPEPRRHLAAAARRARRRTTKLSRRRPRTRDRRRVARAFATRGSPADAPGWGVH